VLVAFLLPVVLQARTTRTNSDSARPKDLIVGTLSVIADCRLPILDCRLDQTAAAYVLDPKSWLLIRAGFAPPKCNGFFAGHLL